MMRELFITGTIMTEQTFILGKDAALEDLSLIHIFKFNHIFYTKEIEK